VTPLSCPVAQDFEQSRRLNISRLNARSVRHRRTHEASS
jgi:hypothetical protein